MVLHPWLDWAKGLRMANYWFRFYSEVLEDPKVQRLSAENFRQWVNILCLVSRQNTPTLPDIEDLAFSLRLTEKATQRVVDELVLAHLLDHTEQGLEPHNWRGRQYKSDVSTDRVKRFRAKSETLHETEVKRFSNGEGNGSVTPPELELDTEIELETEKKNKKRAKARVIRPEGVSQQIWDDFVIHREKGKSTITETVIAGFQREADLAGISLTDAFRISCERGWRGFKAEWLQNGLNIPQAGNGKYTARTIQNAHNLRGWADEQP
jgi:hypothetical protein